MGETLGLGDIKVEGRGEKKKKKGERDTEACAGY